MKKILSIFTLSALLFSACTPVGDFGINPEESKLKYAQEEQVILPEDFTISSCPTVDLASVDGESVQILGINLPNLAGGELGKLVMTLSAEDSDKTMDISISNTGEALVSDLQTAVESIFNKRPVERQFKAEVSGDVLIGAEAYVCKASNSVTVGIIPEAPELSDNYYIVGGALDWAGSCQTKEQKFSHSDKDVYEDPFFSITIPAAASGDTWFAIGDDMSCDKVTAENDWSYLFGTTNGNGESGEQGSFDRRKNLKDDGSFKVAEGCKFIRVTLDVMEGTYTVTPIVADKFYIIGGTLDWAKSCQTKEQKFNHSDKGIAEDPIFTITIPAAASGDTWFAIGDDLACDSVANDNDWSNVFGTTSGNGQSGESGYVDRRKNLKDEGSFKVEEGCSFIRVELNALTFEYKVTALNFAPFIYEIGNESGWGTSHPLAGPEFDGKYQGYYFLDGEFKFKPNEDNWEGDWERGDVYDSSKPWSYKMVQGSDNFPAPYDGAGFYQVNVDLGTMEAYITKVANISLIGNFNGWGADTDMTYNKEGGYWECIENITDSGVKVRLNHDWTISWGGRTSGADYNDLTYFDGQNLDVTPGKYHVKFYLSCEGHNKIVFEAVD